MLPHLLNFLLVALVLYVVYRVVAVFIKDATAIGIVGLFFGIVLIIAGLRIFGIATP